jgi:CHRD domain
MATLRRTSVMPTPVTTTATGRVALVLNDNASTIDYTVTVQNLFRVAT